MLKTKTIKYPRVFSLISGRTEVEDMIVSINRCLGLLLTTAKGELFGDPDFGCRLYETLFDQYSSSMEELVKQDIVENIKKFESRVSVENKDIEIKENPKMNNRNSFTITIRYTIPNTTQEQDVDIIVEERELQNG